MNRPRVLLAAAALVLALAGCGASAPAATAPLTKATKKPLPLLVRGTFSLSLPGFVWNPGVCTGTGGYDDIDADTTVVVTDNAGTTVAIGKLGAGQPVRDPDDPSRAQTCMYTFDIPNVPSGRHFYGIEVGHRGRVQFTEAQLGERVQLELK